MNGDGLESVIESLQQSTESRSDRERGSDAPTALVVSCSMSSYGPREPLWPADATWNLVGMQTLGNQTRERYEGKTVLDHTIEHLRTRHDLTAVLVAGHTGCDVLEDAYERWVGSHSESPAGIRARLDPLRSLVEDGFEEGILAESMPRRTVRYRFVEYNVRRQVRFLREVFPPSVTIAGHVHDQDGAYSSFPDRQYLVALDGETEPTDVRTRLPEDASVQVASLLT